MQTIDEIDLYFHASCCFQYVINLFIVIVFTVRNKENLIMKSVHIISCIVLTFAERARGARMRLVF